MTRIILAALIAGMLVYADHKLQPIKTASADRLKPIRYCMNYSPSVMTAYGPVTALQGAWPCAWLPMEQDV